MFNENVSICLRADVGTKSEVGEFISYFVVSAFHSHLWTIQNWRSYPYLLFELCLTKVIAFKKKLFFWKVQCKKQNLILYTDQMVSWGFCVLCANNTQFRNRRVIIIIKDTSLGISYKSYLGYSTEINSIDSEIWKKTHF